VNAADRRRLTPSLAIVAAILLLILIALWAGLGRGAHWHDKAAPPKLPPVGANLPAPTVPALDQYAEVWQRPLFSPTRTPEAAADDDGEATGDLELTGVIMLPGLKMAILHDRTSNKDYRLVAGQPAQGGPALVELHPRSAVVDNAGARLSLQLIPGPAPAASSGGPQPGAPQPMEGADAGASGMVSRRAPDNSVRQVPMSTTSEPASTAARTRQLKARIEAARRRAARQQHGGGG
jgi:general secretion pathway protein N